MDIRLINVVCNQIRAVKMSTMLFLNILQVETSILVTIHPSIFHNAYPTQCHRESGAYPTGLGAQGGEHHGRGAKPSQGTIIHTFTHFRDAKRRTASLSTGGGNWRKPPRHEEHMGGGEN